MDNRNYLGSHKEEPGMPTATGGKMNLEAVAKGCGIENACTIEDVAAFREKIQSALAKPGPHFIRARVEALDQDGPPKTKRVPDPRENKYQFAGYIQRTEGVEILGSGLGGEDRDALVSHGKLSLSDKVSAIERSSIQNSLSPRGRGLG